MRSIFLSLALVIACSGATSADDDVDGGFVAAKGKRFFAEVARTPAEHAMGLMYRTRLKSDRCMFFAYDQDGYHSIWMKNCYISLDVVWINRDGVVVEIVEDAPPCSPLAGDNCPSYGGSVLSSHFIEFPAGTIKRIGLKIGDQVSWDIKFSNGGQSKGGPPVNDAPPARRTNRTKSGAK